MFLNEQIEQVSVVEVQNIEIIEEVEDESESSLLDRSESVPLVPPHDDFEDLDCDENSFARIPNDCSNKTNSRNSQLLKSGSEFPQIHERFIYVHPPVKQTMERATQYEIMTTNNEVSC